MQTTFRNYAIVVNSKVINVVAWDGKAEYQTDGELIEISNLEIKPSIDWDYIEGEFVDNRPKPELNEDDELTQANEGE
jgi:hypothetical protein